MDTSTMSCALYAQASMRMRLHVHSRAGACSFYTCISMSYAHLCTMYQSLAACACHMRQSYKASTIAENYVIQFLNSGIFNIQQIYRAQYGIQSNSCHELDAD